MSIFSLALICCSFNAFFSLLGPFYVLAPPLALALFVLAAVICELRSSPLLFSTPSTKRG
jgi:hypothetical protein